MVESLETESTMVVVGLGGGGNGELLFNGDRVQFYKMRRVLGFTAT